MTDKFTFVFSEKEISILECALEDHLDRAFGYPGQEQPPYSQYDVAELSAKITERLAW
tara:strand:- start:950 stop:1123 length:174 start_codon:yes stop_codon:yes gene_type:complete